MHRRAEAPRQGLGHPADNLHRRHRPERKVDARSLRESAQVRVETRSGIGCGAARPAPPAGVTPAPGIKRKVARSALLCSRSLYNNKYGSCFLYLYGIDVCVILERSEESRRLFFGLFFGLSLCHSEPLRRRIPRVFFLRRNTQDPEIGILRSADSTLNDTKKDSALNETK